MLLHSHGSSPHIVLYTCSRWSVHTLTLHHSHASLPHIALYTCSRCSLPTLTLHHNHASPHIALYTRSSCITITRHLTLHCTHAHAASQSRVTSHCTVHTLKLHHSHASPRIALYTRSRCITVTRHLALLCTHTSFTTLPNATFKPTRRRRLTCEGTSHHCIMNSKTLYVQSSSKVRHVKQELCLTLYKNSEMRYVDKPVKCKWSHFYQWIMQCIYNYNLCWYCTNAVPVKINEFNIFLIHLICRRFWIEAYGMQSSRTALILIHDRLCVLHDSKKPILYVSWWVEYYTHFLCSFVCLTALRRSNKRVHCLVTSWEGFYGNRLTVCEWHCLVTSWEGFYDNRLTVCEWHCLVTSWEGFYDNRLTVCEWQSRRRKCSLISLLVPHRSELIRDSSCLHTQRLTR